MKNKKMHPYLLLLGVIAMLVSGSLGHHRIIAQATNQFVAIGLWHASADKPSMGNIATDHNSQALYHTDTRMLEIATNPVDVSGYQSAITDMLYDQNNQGQYQPVTVLATGKTNTGEKQDGHNHQITYIKRLQIAIPDYLTKTGVEYIPIKMIVPYTPMDQAVGKGYLEARLRIDWTTVTSTTDQELKSKDQISSGSVQTIILEDEKTGLYLEADSFKVSSEAKLVVNQLLSGAEYDQAVATVGQAAQIYKIGLVKQATSLEPKGAVILRFPYAGDQIQLYRLNQAGKKTKLNGAAADNGYTVLSTQLGIFAIVGGEALTAISETTDKKEFDDIKGHWATEYIKQAVDKGLFKGTSDTTFSPNQSMTGGMIMTVVYRIAGQPSILAASPLPNIKSGSWYEKAAAWGYQNQLIGGYTDFRPEQPVTRQELATILYRYARLTDTMPDFPLLSRFEDSTDIAPWAQQPLAWANAKGMIKGRSDKEIAPQGKASRAEVATILCRFIEQTKRDTKKGQ